MDRLHLDKGKAIRILGRMKSQHCRNMDLSFSNIMDYGDGKTDAETKKSVIGIKGLKPKFFERRDFISDLAFARTGVAMFHEARHLRQLTDPDMNVEIGISAVSVMYNSTYYKASWDELPHEIDAEANGVIGFWDILEEYYPDYADEVMLEYVNWRISESRYMLHARPGGFKSKSEVVKAFEQAYEDSLTKPRRPHPDMKRYPDMLIRLFNTDGRVSPFFHKFWDRMNSAIGSVRDRTLASMVQVLDDEAASSYACLSGVDMDIHRVFTASFLEKSSCTREVIEVPDSGLLDMDGIEF